MGNYTNIFQSLYLSYKLDTNENHQVNFSIGKRIDRPLYTDLNPYPIQTDRYTFRQRNPFLKPSMISIIQFGHTFKNQITTTLSYTKIANQIHQVISITDNVYLIGIDNFGKTIVKSINVNADQRITNWLSAHFYGELVSTIFSTKLNNTISTTKGSYFRTSPNIRLKFSNLISGEINYRFNSKFTTGQLVIDSYHEFGLGIQQQISPATTLRFVENYIFNKRINSGIVNGLSSARAQWTSKVDTRNVTLNLSYRLGKDGRKGIKPDIIDADKKQGFVLVQRPDYFLC